MSCTGSPNHKCIYCVDTLPAVRARKELGPTFTIHAAAARPRTFDLAAAAHEIRLKASRGQHGQQLHGQNYTDTLTLLRGHSRATVDELLKQADLNAHTRLMLKLELYG